MTNTAKLELQDEAMPMIEGVILTVVIILFVVS